LAVSGLDTSLQHILMLPLIIIIISNYIKVRPKASGAGLVCRTDLGWLNKVIYKVVRFYT